MTKRRSNPETIIMSGVISTLKMLGSKAMVWRNNVGAMRAPGGAFVKFGEAGAADVFMVYRGKFYGIEIKTKDGKISPAQLAWRTRVLSAGGVYVLLTSRADAMNFVSVIRE